MAAPAPERLVFIDETWAKSNMARTRAATCGKRLGMGLPHGHRKTTTFIDALTLRGMIVPPGIVLGSMADNFSLLDGAITGRASRLMSSASRSSPELTELLKGISEAANA